MRLSRRAFLDPFGNGAYAVSAVALSVFVFAYSTRFGQVAILLYYAAWLPLFLLDYRLMLGRPSDHLLPAAFVGAMLLSVLWSQAPSVSLRNGGQYLSHVLCALAAARVVGLRSLTRGFLVGSLVVVLYSLAFGEYGYDQMDGSYTFVGAFGSKNQFGFYCSLGIFFAAVHLFVVRDGKLLKLATLLVAALFVGGLAASRSAGSILTLGVALALLVGQLLLLFFAPRQRVGLLIGIVPLAAGCVIAFAQFGGADAILGLFGKDSTLTGRTYLWQVGLDAATLHPVLGVGYQAYWVQGFSMAERLWAEFYIPNRTGFHFHNTFIETFVELGAVGLAIFVGTLLTVLVRTVSGVFGRFSTEAACYLALFSMLLVRAFTEVDCLYPFMVGSFILFFVYYASRRRSVRAPRRSPAVPLAVPPLGVSA